VPRTARIEEADQVREVPVECLHVGDIVVVRPGDRVPSDGSVIEGRSEVDEAPVIGESVPVAKRVGDQVYAGSINANGMLRVRLTHTAGDNTIARIIHLVEEAQGSKAPTARFIDRFAAYYTPTAMAVAALIIIGPPLIAGPIGIRGSIGDWRRCSSLVPARLSSRPPRQSLLASRQLRGVGFS
jgi:Cd2+/Zn2+-exporting ATPase